MIIQLIQNDTRPRLTYTVKQNGVAVNITGATVKFKFRKIGASTNIFSRTCTLSDPTNGVCYVDWIAGDLDEVGDYEGEVEVTFSGGQVQTSQLIGFNVRAEF